jgi:YfiH family protein
MAGPILVERRVPEGILLAFSERGIAPPGTPSPTELLARRLARSLGVPYLPLVRATQVHGRDVVDVTTRPARGETIDAGSCDALMTTLTGVGLVVQTADCVPVLLAAPDAVGAIHAGWRGAAAGVARGAAESFLRSTADPASARAWLGPAIGPCCYEVGGEVAARFEVDFVRASSDGKYRLDLRAAVRRGLESAGVPAGNVTQEPACTMCGGARYASWRRDRENAGRMIALVARVPGLESPAPRATRA